jgi:hypothetical protein
MIRQVVLRKYSKSPRPLTSSQTLCALAQALCALTQGTSTRYSRREMASLAHKYAPTRPPSIRGERCLVREKPIDTALQLVVAQCSRACGGRACGGKACGKACGGTVEHSLCPHKRQLLPSQTKLSISPPPPKKNQILHVGIGASAGVHACATPSMAECMHVPRPR